MRKHGGCLVVLKHDESLYLYGKLLKDSLCGEKVEHKLFIFTKGME